MSKKSHWLFFDGDELPEASLEYVAWVDVMGTQVSMSRSLRQSANFIFKLHIAAHLAPKNNVRIYPVMDGFYASAKSQDDMLEFLKSVMHDVASQFIQEKVMHHCFIARGALAYGPVIHGNDVPEDAFRESDKVPARQVVPAHRNMILLGLPMVQAHTHERQAPPFGIFVHESARTFAPSAGELKNGEPIHFIWWKWRPNDSSFWNDLGVKLEEYYDWCEERADAIGYEASRIKAHRSMAKQHCV